jgi:hypothetical protein
MIVADGVACNAGLDSDILRLGFDLCRQTANGSICITGGSTANALIWAKPIGPTSLVEAL